MDATDARRLVVDLCRREGVELGRVLGRERTLAIVLVRRAAILELRARGVSYRAIGATMSRDHKCVLWIARRALATSPDAPAR